MKTDKIKRLLQALAVLTLAGIFLSLGNWQLTRARDLKVELNRDSASQEIGDTRVYSLKDLTSAQGALPVAAIGKSISLQGHYIATYKAPNQVDRDGTVADWEVALTQVDSSSAILVVRGLWSERLTSPEIVMATNVTITGRIYPGQVSDRTSIRANELSRIDPSALTSLTDFQLYDGFISASSENYRDGEITRTRVEIEIAKNGTPGYYWQHISYVVIWWLMAILVLWAPFYKRREESDSQKA